MQRFIREVTCDRCGADVAPENSHVIKLNNKLYDLCPTCRHIITIDIEEFTDFIIEGCNNITWQFKPFAHPEGRPINED